MQFGVGTDFNLFVTASFSFSIFQKTAEKIILIKIPFIYFIFISRKKIPPPPASIHFELFVLFIYVPFSYPPQQQVIWFNNFIDTLCQFYVIGI